MTAAEQLEECEHGNPMDGECKECEIEYGARLRRICEMCGGGNVEKGRSWLIHAIKDIQKQKGER